MVGMKSENVHGTHATSKIKRATPRMSHSDSAVWDPPGRDLERGKPLFRRKKGKMEDQYF